MLMKFYESEKEMPFGEIERGDGTVHHLVCDRSRRHVVYYDSSGMHCSVKNCELNIPVK